MAPSCEHGGNGSCKRHSPKGRQIPPNSHRSRRREGDAGPDGFRTNWVERRRGRPAGESLRPAPLPAAPHPRAAAAFGGPGAARPRLAALGGLHLRARWPRPGPGNAARRLSIRPPHPRSPACPSQGPSPSPRAPCAPGPGLAQREVRGGGVRRPAPSSAGKALPPGRSD